MKKIVNLVILIIIGVGAWYLVTKTQQNVMSSDPNLAGGIMMEGTSVPFEDTEFRLAQYNGVGTPDDSNYTLVFDGDRLSARFCNTMGGNYTVNGNVIVAPELVSTLMFCESPVDLMNMETGFGQIMAEGAIYKLEGDMLEISSVSGEHTFVYNVPAVIAQ